MNEQLQKLDDQACDYANSKVDDNDEDWSFQWDRDHMTKFAELIIRDCVGVWHAIDNGNEISGTRYFPEALFTRYGIDVKKEPTNITYPCLGCYPSGAVVLFTSLTKGTLLRGGNDSTLAIGVTNSNYTPDWVPFKGKFVMEN